MWKVTVNAAFSTQRLNMWIDDEDVRHMLKFGIPLGLNKRWKTVAKTWRVVGPVDNIVITDQDKQDVKDFQALLNSVD
jgi:hypothetical protein